MTDRYLLRQATAADLPRIMDLLRARVKWLREDVRSDQWEDVANWESLLRYLVRRGQTWVMATGEPEILVGTVTLTYDPDLEFWTLEERSQRALYVSKLATDPRYSGEGLGQQMLAFALDTARERRLGVVRLDVWKTADGLIRYYEDLGWRKIRTEPGSRRSGVLFDHEVVAPDTAPLSREAIDAMIGRHGDKAPRVQTRRRSASGLGRLIALRR